MSFLPLPGTRPVSPIRKAPQMKDRVEPLTAHPAPGTVTGSDVRVTLEGAGPGVRVIFTRDGTKPTPCLATEHHSRSEEYDPARSFMRRRGGIRLRGFGTHRITTVSMKDGCCDTMQRFTWRLVPPDAAAFSDKETPQIDVAASLPPRPATSLDRLAHRESQLIIPGAHSVSLPPSGAASRGPTRPSSRQRSPSLFDADDARRFETSVRRTATTPMRAASAGGKSVALIETTSKAALLDRRGRGEDVALFGVVPAQRGVVERETRFRRLMPPFMALARELRGEPRPASPADRTATSPPCRSRPATSLPLVRPRPQSPMVAAAAESELAWFDRRVALYYAQQKARRGEDDRDPTSSDDDMVMQLTTHVPKVTDGKARQLSLNDTLFSRRGTYIPRDRPIDLSRDVAGASRGLIRLVFTADAVARSEVYGALCLDVSYTLFDHKFRPKSKPMNPSDIAAVAGWPLPQARVLLDEILGMVQHPIHCVSAALLKIFFRFRLWHDASVDHAMLLLVHQYLTGSGYGAAQVVTRVEIDALLTVLRTRGAPVEISEALQEALGSPSMLTEGIDGTLLADALAAVPCIGAGLALVSNLAHPMYHRHLDDDSFP